jgi:two-component system NtrC family sensor kinase
VELKLIGEGPGTMVLGDASKLLQILTNLTVNAQQSMLDGGRITLAVGKRRATPPTGDSEADYQFVDVRDEGTGITQRNLPRIFDTFFTTKKEGGGTGLGLSVSYRIASEHGGWIGVESQPGAGSCFTLYLPPLAMNNAREERGGKDGTRERET